MADTTSAPAVTVTPAHRFAAAARQGQCRRSAILQPSSSSVRFLALREARAIDLARYWESFPESYTVEQARLGAEVVVAAAAGPLTMALVSRVIEADGSGR